MDAEEVPETPEAEDSAKLEGKNKLEYAIIAAVAIVLALLVILQPAPEASPTAVEEARSGPVLGVFKPVGINGTTVKADIDFAVSSGNALGVNPCYEVFGADPCDGYTCIETALPVPDEYANRTFTVYTSYETCLEERNETPPCEADSDCGPGEICLNGSCGECGISNDTDFCRNCYLHGGEVKSGEAACWCERKGAYMDAWFDSCMNGGTTCVGEGGIMQDGVPGCCPGLTRIGCSSPEGVDGCEPCTGGFCTYCGDGDCKAPETDCNCPQDCAAGAQEYSCSDQPDTRLCPVDDCLPGYSCRPNSARTACQCVPDNVSCGGPGDGECAGFCPTGQICMPQPSGCACVLPYCGDGVCDPAFGENCECTDCAGSCPDGTRCDPGAADADSMGCTKSNGGPKGTCVLGDGNINPGEECDTNANCLTVVGEVCSSTNCTCIMPDCESSLIPYCLGSCPEGENCIPSGPDCYCKPECESLTAEACGNGSCADGRACVVMHGACECPPDVDQYNITVLSFSFIPTDPENESLVDLTVTSTDAFLHPGATVQYVRDRISLLDERLLEALQQASTYHGYKDPSAEPSLLYSNYEHREYLEAVPTRLSLSFDGVAPYYQLWHLNTVENGDYMGIDMRVGRNLTNFTIYFWYIDHPAHFHVEASATGEFAGEQVTILTETTKDGFTAPPDHISIRRKKYTFPTVYARYLKIVMDEDYANQLNVFDAYVGEPLYGVKVSFSRNTVPYRLDHRIMLTQYVDICDYVDNHGLKEVWVWMYHNDEYLPYIAPVESYQRGPDHQMGNGFMDLPLCNHSYTVYDYNYGRELGMALENQAHHKEVVFKYINRTYFNDYFVGPSGPGLPFYRCGWTHVTPNAMQFLPWPQYNWYITALALSDCEDWTPDGSGEKKMLNCETWEDVFIAPERGADLPGSCPVDGGSAFKVWWMQNLPGKDNDLYYGGRKMRNWWEFIGDFDYAIAKGASFFE